MRDQHLSIVGHRQRLIAGSQTDMQEYHAVQCYQCSVFQVCILQDPPVGESLVRARTTTIHVCAGAAGEESRKVCLQSVRGQAVGSAGVLIEATCTGPTCCHVSVNTKGFIFIKKFTTSRAVQVHALSAKAADVRGVVVKLNEKRQLEEERQDQALLEHSKKQILSKKEPEEHQRVSFDWGAYLIPEQVLPDSIWFLSRESVHCQSLTKLRVKLRFQCREQKLFQSLFREENLSMSLNCLVERSRDAGITAITQTHGMEVFPSIPHYMPPTERLHGRIVCAEPYFDTASYPDRRTQSGQQRHKPADARALCRSSSFS
jgi:hypothetical protein